MRQLRSPSRWTWVVPVVATAFIVACDTSLDAINQEGIWGFVTVSAQKSGTAHFANAEGIFFSGNLSAVPNADFTTADTCSDGVLTEGNNLVGVTYLDAGPNVSTTIGGVGATLDRITTANGITYRPASPPAYTPGDSIVVELTGVPGGFPGGSIRAKTAEAFEFPVDIPVPAGTEAIQLNWTAPQAPRSAMVVSLRYATSLTPSTLSRHVLCTFIDDGEVSIPFAWHSNWSSSSGAQAVVATRLRTNYVAAGDGNLGVISTYQVPTPPRP